MAAVIPPISQTGMMRCGGVRWLGSIRQWPPHVCRGPSMTHLIWVGAILVRHDFCLPMTHQVHLGRRRGSGRPPSISPHGPLPREGPLQGSSLGSESWPGATQSRPSLEAAHQEPRPHLEVIDLQNCRLRPPVWYFITAALEEQYGQLQMLRGLCGPHRPSSAPRACPLCASIHWLLSRTEA